MQFLRWRLKWFIMLTQKTRSENKEKEKEEEEEKEEEKEQKEVKKEEQEEEEVPGVVTTAAIGKPLAMPFAMVTEQHKFSVIFN